MAGINFDFTGGTLPPGITFTRASIGTYVNNAGTLITAGNDVARLNYVSGVANLLIEPSATNLCLQSNTFSGTGDWGMLNSGVVTASQFVSPDGTNNGWKLANGVANAALIYQNFTFAAAPYAISVWAKQMVGTPPIQGNMGGFLSGNITTSATLTRYSYTVTATAGAGIGGFYCSDLILGDALGIYGCQLETGSKSTSYIPTTTAAVTRAADNAVFTIPAGVSQLTYTFDDNSTQVVSVAAGSYTIPVSLNRPNIKSIAGVQVAPSTVQLGPYQSLGLTAGSPVQITATGTYNLAILNTGPGNLYISYGNTPGANATSIIVPALKMAPPMNTAGQVWLSADQDGGVSIAAMPR